MSFEKLKNEDINVSELQEQTNSEVSKEILAYFKVGTRAPDTFGRFKLSVDQKQFLGKIKKNVYDEMKAVQSTNISIRQTILTRLGAEDLTAFDDLVTEAELYSVQSKLYNTLNEEQRKSYPENQLKGAEIFNRILKGEEFLEISLSEEEKRIIGDIRMLRLKGELKKGDDAYTKLSKFDQLVHANFIQGIAYLYSSGRLNLEQKQEPLDSVVTETQPESLSEKPSKPESKEGFREAIQEGIGDLNGSYESFTAHLLSRNLIEQKGAELVWKGGNKKVVFVGDILGDRDTTGTKVIVAIGKLNEQAQKEGGSVECIGGNHDNFFTSVLGGYNIEDMAYENISREMFDDNPGLLEPLLYAKKETKETILALFDKVYPERKLELEKSIRTREKIMSEQVLTAEVRKTYEDCVRDIKRELAELEEVKRNPDTENDDIIRVALKYLDRKDKRGFGEAIMKNREKILEKMRTDTKGREFLESLCNQKLAVTIDDLLYTHTNLTIQMTREILKGATTAEGVHAVNALYQKGLHFFMLGEGSMTEEEQNQFHELRTMFMTTGNSGEHRSRTNFTEDDRLQPPEKEQLKNDLKTKGTAMAVHGHNAEDKALGDPDFRIVSIDKNVYKGAASTSMNSPIATITVDLEGGAMNTATKEIYRDKA